MFHCECGKRFNSEDALSQHIGATGHKLPDAQVGEVKSDEPGALKVHLALIESNEDMVEFVCGECGWPIAAGQPLCGFCGQTLVWETPEDGI